MRFYSSNGSGISTAGGAEPVPVGLQKQLLVDDYVIAEKHNATRS